MENINLIRKIAWSFHKSTGIDYQEIFAEACRWYWEAKITWNPSRRASFTTYAWRVMRNKLVDFTAIEKVRRMHGIYNAKYCSPKVFKELLYRDPAFNTLQFNELEIDSLKTNHPETMLDFQPPSFADFYASLPKESKDLAEAILSSLEALSDLSGQKEVRGKIVQILRGKGWSWARIWESFAQIKIVLNH